MENNINVKHEEGTVTLTQIIEADMCDIKQTWKSSETIAAMQRATHYAREYLGIGWSDMESKGKLWVVSRLNVEFERVPHLGEKIDIKAIPLPAQKFLYPWRFEFTDEKGIRIGKSQSLWNLMDKETRRIAFAPEIASKVPDTYKLPVSQCIPQSAQELDITPVKGTLTPSYTDLDINGHTSHIHYIDWCCNALGKDIMEKYSLQKFRISYLQEVKYGEVIETHLQIDNNKFSYSGYSGENNLFIADGEFH